MKMTNNPLINIKMLTLRNVIHLLIITYQSMSCYGNIVETKCNKNESICEFHLRLEERLTMTYTLDGEDQHSNRFLPFATTGNHGNLTLLETCTNQSAGLSQSQVEGGNLIYLLHV